LVSDKAVERWRLSMRLREFQRKTVQLGEGAEYAAQRRYVFAWNDYF
jgi:predicted HTH domain antitoxin